MPTLPTFTTLAFTFDLSRWLPRVAISLVTSCEDAEGPVFYSVADTYSETLDTLTIDVGDEWTPDDPACPVESVHQWHLGMAEGDLVVDTALSMDGRFPRMKGDAYVDLRTPEGEPLVVRVSARYTAVRSPREAARIALDAAAETLTGGSLDGWFVVGVTRVE